MPINRVGRLPRFAARADLRGNYDDSLELRKTINEVVDAVNAGGGGGGGAPTTAKYIVQQPDATLSAEQALSSLATGVLKSTTGTGVVSIAAGSDLPSHTHAGGDVTSAVADSNALGTYAASQYPRKGISNTFTAEQIATVWSTTLAGYLLSPNHSFVDSGGVSTTEFYIAQAGSVLTLDDRIATGTFEVKVGTRFGDAVNYIEFGTAGAMTLAGSTVGSLVTGFNADKLDGYEGATLAVKTLGITIDGGGAAIATGLKGTVTVPYAGTLSAWYMTADQTGSIVIDVWKDAFGSYPPTDADAMPGAGKEPTISAASSASDTDISDWTTRTVAAGDVLSFNVDSCTTITRVTLVLKVTVT